MTPYERGFRRGVEDSRRVLDLEYHSELYQFSSDYMPDFKPASLMERRQWLLGYSAGIHRALVLHIMDNAGVLYRNSRELP